MTEIKLYRPAAVRCGFIESIGFGAHRIKGKLGKRNTIANNKSALNLLPLLKNGTYANLTNEVYKLRNESDPLKLEKELIRIAKKYTSKIKRAVKKDATPIVPQIIISETFITQ